MECPGIKFDEGKAKMATVLASQRRPREVASHGGVARAESASRGGARGSGGLFAMRGGGVVVLRGGAAVLGTETAAGSLPE